MPSLTGMEKKSPLDDWLTTDADGGATSAITNPRQVQSVRELSSIPGDDELIC